MDTLSSSAQTVDVLRFSTVAATGAADAVLDKTSTTAMPAHNTEVAQGMAGISAP
ncbi:hypothetical protein [Pseudomonas sp. 3A(2025)]